MAKPVREALKFLGIFAVIILAFFLFLKSRNLATGKTLAASGEPQIAVLVFHGWKGDVYVVRPNETLGAVC